MSNDAIKPEKKKRSFNKRKFKYGFVATVITLVFIAVVIVGEPNSRYFDRP